MDLGHLEALVAVAEERGFSRAAQRLHRTQPAISQTLKRLEQELGTPLIDRSSKDGTLTDAGRVLYEHALQLLALRTKAHQALRQLDDLESGHLSIAANEYTVLHLLPLLELLRRRHPQIRVEVRRSLASRIPQAILEREVDFGLVAYGPAQRGLTALPLAHDPLALLVAPSHPLAGRDEVSVRELGGESFLAHNVRSPWRERVIHLFEQQRTPLNIVMELPTLESIRRLVERGLGVALMPRHVAQPELARGDLCALKVREVRLERPIHLVHRSGAQLSHAAQALLSCAEEWRPGGQPRAGRPRASPQRPRSGAKGRAPA